MALTRKQQRKLDDIILTISAYQFMSTQRRRDYALDCLIAEIGEYLTWAA